jgi:dolichyl-phosphate-mannose--protein O-mannosyl transferase
MKGFISPGSKKQEIQAISVNNTNDYSEQITWKIIFHDEHKDKKYLENNFKFYLYHPFTDCYLGSNNTKAYILQGNRGDHDPDVYCDKKDEGSIFQIVFFYKN